MRKYSILIVEDEINLQNLIERILQKEGYQVFKANNGTEAHEIILEQKIDIVLTDIKMPGMTGIELLKLIKSIDNSIEVIIMTAFATVDTAIEALKMGACDYIRKPFDIEEIISSIQKTNLIINSVPNSPPSGMEIEDMIVANSRVMIDLVKMVKKISASIATVYISGETGVGKEIIARAIHELSPRKNKPFIKVNCSALPETLLESELFGYEKGAFTGAYARKLGRFELAHEGTIFLDEIGDISQLIQLKLLRIIQQKEIERLGGTKTIPLDVRIIVATNRNLEELVESGVFREDLYYRLNVIPIHVPPLRERVEDIRQLIQIFLSSATGTYNTVQKTISDEAIDMLSKYAWPGNVRELENIVERLLVISEGSLITNNDLPSKITDSIAQGNSSSLEASKENTEEKVIRQALVECGGNITHAAEKLGISRRSLHRKINKYQIET